MSKVQSNIGPFDEAKVERVFKRYPKWIYFICAGTISLKATREILGIDRYECYDAYLDMMEAGAIYGSGSNMYRASPALKEYLSNKQVNHVEY